MGSLSQIQFLMRLIGVIVFSITVSACGGGSGGDSGTTNPSSRSNPDEDSTPIIPVDPDNISPVIELLGETVIRISLNSTYTDEGAVATDEEDGDLTSEIVTLRTVNTSVVGYYLLRQQVTDSAGSTTHKTRIVRVIDSSPAEQVQRTISGTGANQNYL